jgi:hypothetical protein
MAPQYFARFSYNNWPMEGETDLRRPDFDVIIPRKVQRML